MLEQAKANSSTELKKTKTKKSSGSSLAGFLLTSALELEICAVPTIHTSDCLVGLRRYETASSHRGLGERFDDGLRGTDGDAAAEALSSRGKSRVAEDAVAEANAAPTARMSCLGRWTLMVRCRRRACSADTVSMKTVSVLDTMLMLTIVLVKIQAKDGSWVRCIYAIIDTSN